MISLQDVSVSLHGHEILHGIDAELPTGSWTCIVGPNGAGKTTLLRVLIGAQPFHGEVSVHGKALDARGESQVFAAFVAQRPAIPAGMRVAEYVTLGRFPHGQSRAGRKSVAVVEETLAALHLTSVRHRVLASLSGGELQRCTIARALAQQAPVLVLDEPTSALDLHRQPAILDLIDEQRRLRGMTVVSTMHDITLAAMYAQQFVVLDQGRVVDAGSTFEVCQREALAKAFNHNIEIVMSPRGTPVVLPKRG